jgi:septation ring formation regulator EzrA
MILHRSLKKWWASCEKSPMVQDFFRGVAYAREGIIQAPGSAFYKVEEIRLHYRLAKIKRNIFDEHLTLGRLVIDGLTGDSPLISEDDIERIYQRIASLMEDQQRIEAESEELAVSISSQTKGMGTDNEEV